MTKLNDYEQKLLDGWEEVAKKGQLTLWIMLALKEGPKHMAQIKSFLARATKNIISADDQSLYRALRRYNDAGMVDFETQAGKNGPDLKIYKLTDSGEKILTSFLERNVINVFFKSEIKTLIERSKKNE